VVVLVFFVAIGYKSQDLNNTGLGYGYTTWILLAAWIVELLASCTHAGWGSQVYA